MDRVLSIISLALCMLCKVSAQTVELSEMRFSDARFELVAYSDTDSILTLQRIDGDSLPGSTTSPVAMGIGQSGMPLLLQEYSPSGLSRGFFHVTESDLATHLGDADSDGIQDRIELKAAGFLHPLESADAGLVDVFELSTLGADISDGVPAVGAGHIESSYSADLYTFDGEADTGVFVDVVSYASELSAHDYQIVDPYGQTLAMSRFGYAEIGPVNLPYDGEYVLLVGDTEAADVGTYAISLSIIPAPQTFSIVIGDTIEPDEPSSGAGTVEVPGAYDIYTFMGSEDQRIFIDLLSYSDISHLYFSMIDPSGNELDWHYFYSGDMGTIELPETGTYTLVVGNSSSDQTGTYAIAITMVPDPDTFAINIGDTIADGSPSAGAGNIEVPGAFDTYTFTGVAGESIYVDLISYTDISHLYFSLIDPSGDELDWHYFYSGDLGTIELPETGTYTLAVGNSSSDQTGTYSIAITTVPDPDTFAINIGDTIADGSPSTGAGNIEVPGAFDNYTFTGVAGESIYVDLISYTDISYLYFSLIDPSGDELDWNYFYSGDLGTIELPETGTYTLAVGNSSRDQTGTYSIVITAVPDPDTFAINIGDTIAEGSPSTGAGNIEVPGAFDSYTFAGVAGESIYVDRITYEDTSYIKYSLIDPSGNTLGSKALYASDLATVELPETGTYTLVVGNSSLDQTGTYSIAITAVPDPDTFAINIGDTVADGSPSTGAGNIEVPGAYDRYTFAGVAGDSIYVDRITYEDTSNIEYSLIDPSGNTLGSKVLYASDLGSVELPETGTYTLVVGNSSQDQTGTYSIAIISEP
jgi:hypothetical protein